MFINSDPPFGRKARELAISISAHEAMFLRHLSYVDTTKLMKIERDLVDAAITVGGRLHGRLSPALCRRIAEGVLAHDVLIEEHRAYFQ